MPNPEDTPISGLSPYSTGHGDDITVIVNVRDKSMASRRVRISKSKSINCSGRPPTASS